MRHALNPNQGLLLTIVACAPPQEDEREALAAFLPEPVRYVGRRPIVGAEARLLRSDPFGEGSCYQRLRDTHLPVPRILGRKGYAAGQPRRVR